MQCNVSKQQLYDWIDSDASELEAHLAECQQCRELTEAYRQQITNRQQDNTATVDVPYDERPSDDPLSGIEPVYVQPEHIGPYRIAHELGRGGMGIVYLGVMEEDNIRQRVAIKVLKRGTDTEETLHRFERERQLLASLNHPNIAQLYQTGRTEDNLPYYSMEYVEGLPIDEYCDKKKLGIEVRLDIFIKVCAAVSYAHQNLVVHRDLKPDNIIVSDDGVPKLLDFGIAKLLNPEITGGGMPTLPGQLLMTPEYAAPEQVLGDKITTACDVYSLGVILFELLTGHRPYQLKKRIRREIERVLVEVIPQKPSKAIAETQEIPIRASGSVHTGTTTQKVTPDSVSTHRGLRIERLRRKLSGDLDNIVLMALRKSPADRYQQVDRLVDDVERHLHGLPVFARPQSWSYRTSKFLQRNKASTAITALVAISMSFGIWAIVSDLQSTTAFAVAEAAELEADAEQTRADQRELQFDQLNSFLLDDLYEVVAKLPNSPQVSELIMNQAIKVIEVLETSPVFNTDDALSLAHTYAKLSEVQSGVRNPELGLQKKSALSLDRAEQLCDRVLSDRPNDVEATRLRVSILRHRGDFAFESKRYDEAKTQYLASVDIAVALFNADSSALFNRRLYASTLLNVGDVFSKLGDDDTAEENYNRSFAIRKLTLESHPEDTRTRRDYTVALNRLGGVASKKGNYDEAIALYEEALQYREELWDENPFANREARDVANSHLLLSTIYNMQDAKQKLMFHYQTYVDLVADLAAMSPQDVRAQEDMRMARNAIASIYKTTGDNEKAEYDYWLFGQLITRQLDNDPEKTAFKIALVKNNLELARLLSDLGRTSEAITALQEANAICGGTNNDDLSELCEEVVDQLDALAPSFVLRTQAPVSNKV